MNELQRAAQGREDALQLELRLLRESAESEGERRAEALRQAQYQIGIVTGRAAEAESKVIFLFVHASS